MYASHYNLRGRPFQLSPDHRFYYPSRGHKKAMAYLTYGMNERDGFIVITGHVGAGKTTIVGQLLSQIDQSKFVSANIVTTQLGSDDTLRMVARAFGLPAESRDKASILKDIEGFLAARRAEGKHVVLVIDEVQNMPLEAIEELRMLSNFQLDNRPLVQCFLLGQPEFREKLARPEMEQIRQRVIATCHLEPLAADETKGYIEHRLKLVGWEGDPDFPDDAFDQIHRVTGGVPRRINSLCGRLLLYGSLEDTHVIDATVVQDVAREIAEEAGASSAYRPRVSASGLIEGLAPEGGESLDDLDRRVAVLRGTG